MEILGPAFHKLCFTNLKSEAVILFQYVAPHFQNYERSVFQDN